MRVPQSPKPIGATGLPPLSDLLGEVGGATVRGKYVHWDKLRRLAPPSGFNSESWWALVKLSRQLQYRTVPLSDTSGRPFVYMLPDAVQRALHDIDSRAHGWLGGPDKVDKGGLADERFIIGSLIDEAISSSQLEGASTTRAVAREMIRRGRRPKDADEQMIVNNYRGISRIREIRGQRLTMPALLELHRTLTADTLDDPTAEGRLQRDTDIRVGVYSPDGDRVHQPPPASALPERLGTMLRFANGDDEADEAFVHPVVRAIVLHFWLAYEHPFLDGNGRTARALFYWCMLRQGYWMFEFISISQWLLKAPVQYARAFLETETDGNDLTYFIVHHMRVIQRSLAAFEDYAKRKVEEVAELEQTLKRTPGLNHRQLALLAHALRHPDAEYTVRSHQTSHSVAHGTARTDLLRLADGGFLEHSRAGRRKSVFFPATDLPDRITG